MDLLCGRRKPEPRDPFSGPWLTESRASVRGARARGTFTTEQRAVAGVMEDAIIPDAGTSNELLVFRTDWRGVDYGPRVARPAPKADSQEFSRLCVDFDVGQATKGARGMPWRHGPKKGVARLR